MKLLPSTVTESETSTSLTVNLEMFTSPPPAKKPVTLAGLASNSCPDAGAVIITVGLIPSTAYDTEASPTFPRLSETFTVNL